MKRPFQINYHPNFLLVLLQSIHPIHACIIYITSSTHLPSNPRSRALPPLLGRKCSVGSLTSRRQAAMTKRSGWPHWGLRRYAESKLWSMMFIPKLQSRVHAVPALSHLCRSGFLFSARISCGEQSWINRRPLRRLIMVVTLSLVT